MRSQASVALVQTPALRAEQRALADSLFGAAKPSSLLWTRTADSGRRVNMFGLNIENTYLVPAARELISAAKEGRRTRAVFANAHVINTIHTDAVYKATVASADRIYADGSGMAIAARIAGRPLNDNVNGTDLFPLLCAEAKKAGVKIFLLGGKPGVAQRAAANVTAFGLGEAIGGVYHGYFVRGSREEDEIIARINASGAGIVLVGFGVPVQDIWIANNAHRLDAAVIAGVGGLFDFFAGTVERSPKIMRSFGCEWVWRLAMEPRRMARRYLIGNAVFLRHSVQEGVRVRQALRPAAALTVNSSETINR